MDIKLTDSLLRDYVKTEARAEEIAEKVSLCGPTVDRLHKLENDWLYEIEIITNRVDSASAFGVAREVAAILPEFGVEAELINNPYEMKIELPEGKPAVDVQIMDQRLMKRFSCVALKNIKVGPAARETASLLEAVGVRSLNNVIDVSNELTLRYGQPVHIFDLNKIGERKMIVRESRKGEVVKTLDGRSHKLLGKDIVIEDGRGRLIDLCGIMGGALSEVDDKTEEVLLFVQTYEPKHIRRTSLYTQERTLAAQLCEKSPDPELVMPVLMEGIKMLEERAGGMLSSSVIDIYNRDESVKTIDLPKKWMEEFVGVKVEAKQVERILKRLGFGVVDGGERWKCSLPSWRREEVEDKEDLVEEIMRVIGYFRLPSRLPETRMPETETEKKIVWERRLRDYLSSVGWVEVLTNSLVSKEMVDKVGLEAGEMVKLRNPLSEDYEYLRTSLIPEALEVLRENKGRVKGEVKIFEVSRVYKDGAKNEPLRLLLTAQGMNFYEFKGEIENLLVRMHIKARWEVLKSFRKPFVGTRTAQVKVNEEIVGVVGQIEGKTVDNFELEGEVMMADLDFEKIVEAGSEIAEFVGVTKEAGVIEEITIKSNASVIEIEERMVKVANKIREIEYLDSFEDKKTFRVVFDVKSRKEAEKLKGDILVSFEQK